MDVSKALKNGIDSASAKDLQLLLAQAGVDLGVINDHTEDYSKVEIATALSNYDEIKAALEARGEEGVIYA